VSRFSWLRLRVGILVVTVAGFVAFALNASDTHASGENWGPAGDKVFIDSTNMEIQVGTITVKCEATAGTGTLSEPGSSTWTVTPSFSRCNYPVVAKGAWTATDLNSSEATLEIPKEEKAISIEVSSGCIVNLEAGGTLGSASDYTNGENGMTEPSMLELISQTTTVKDSSKACVTVPCSKEEAKSATFNGNILLFNYSSEAEAVKVT
jgi:hypothetical protein